MKKVTIMIPTYNQSQYIEQAIQSAQQIKYENLEIIVSDDNSTDDTEEVVSKFLDDERIKYFKNEPNLGRVANYRKTLYEYATGDYVLNLDGDDWLDDVTFINDAIILMDNNPTMSCVLGDRKNYYEFEDRYRVFSNENNPHVSKIMNGNQLLLNYHNIGFIFSHFGCLYRRELAMKLGFYTKNIVSSDTESIFKLFVNHQIGYIPKVAGIWRAHESNESYTRSVKQVIENLSKYDAVYNLAKEYHIASNELLNQWHFNMKKGNLSQDILYEFRAFGFKKSSIFIYEILKYDASLSTASFIQAIIKLFKKIKGTLS